MHVHSTRHTDIYVRHIQTLWMTNQGQISPLFMLIEVRIISLSGETVIKYVGMECEIFTGHITIFIIKQKWNDKYLC